MPSHHLMGQHLGEWRWFERFISAGFYGSHPPGLLYPCEFRNQARECDILIKEDAQFLRSLAVEQITRLKIMFVQYFPVLSLDIFNHLSYPFQFKIFTVEKSKVKFECFPQGIFIEGFLLSKTNISRKTLDPCSSAKQR